MNSRRMGRCSGVQTGRRAMRLEVLQRRLYLTAVLRRRFVCIDYVFPWKDRRAKASRPFICEGDGLLAESTTDGTPSQSPLPATCAALRGRDSAWLTTASKNFGGANQTARTGRSSE